MSSWPVVAMCDAMGEGRSVGQSRVGVDTGHHELAQLLVKCPGSSLIENF